MIFFSFINLKGPKNNEIYVDDTDDVHIVSYDAVNLQFVYFNNISGSFEQYYFPAENYGYGTFNSMTLT